MVDVEKLLGDISAFGEHYTDGDARLQIAFGLGPAGAKLLSALMLNDRITEQDVVAKSIATDARVAIWRLREKLTPKGIHVQSRRLVGWWMEDVDKEAVLGRLSETSSGAGDGHGQ